MALTQLDSVAAFIVIDLQKGVVALPTIVPSSEITSRSAQLAQAFRERGFPVVLVNVKPNSPGRTQVAFPKRELPPDWSDLVPELGQQAGDFLVTKHHVSAFIDTPLDESLHRRSVTQIFLAGIATSIGVESTGRNAYDLGYNVVFVEDAMSDINREAHRHCLEYVFPRFGETETTENVLETLSRSLAK